MVEILRTNDLVLISVIESILTAERVSYFVADQNMAAAEGSLGFLPRRIMVDAREAGLLELKHDTMRLTARGRIASNEVFSRLLVPAIA